MSQRKMKMTFEDMKSRDRQLRAFPRGSYRIDVKNPLTVWVFY